MSDLAIRVENLSKQYKIGGPQVQYKTLREGLSGLVKVPIQRLRNHHLRNISERIWALRDVSFDVRQGEVLGIIGRNGAGKSTLLKILARITRPTSGKVRLRGRVGSLLEVGTGFHPELTGRENIYLNGAILGMTRSEIQSKFDEIIDFSEIEQFLDTPVKRYSSGMYMRLAFSVAAHLEPEILLVDEVLAVGDIAFQKKCLGKMGNVAREGRTVLLVSHNLAAIKQICQQGILLDKGITIKISDVNEVIQEYIGYVSKSLDSVELRTEDHVTGVNGIRVNRVKLINSVNGNFSIYWKQPIQLLLDIEVQKPVKYVNFGLGVTTVDGIPILTVHNTDYGDDPVSLMPGYYQIEIEIQNELRLGLYNLIIGAHDSVAKSSIFYIPNAIQLEILNSAISTEPYFEHNSGIINGQSKWHINNCR